MPHNTQINNIFKKPLLTIYLKNHWGGGSIGQPVFSSIWKVCDYRPVGFDIQCYLFVFLCVFQSLCVSSFQSFNQVMSINQSYNDDAYMLMVLSFFEDVFGDGLLILKHVTLRSPFGL